MAPDTYRTSVTFKEKKTFAERKAEASAIRTRYHEKVPVIIERYKREKKLPMMGKTKFLVPGEITMSQLVTIIRNRMQLSQTQSFYLLVNNRTIASMSSMLSEIYMDDQDEDGFLYMTYASQEMFG